MTVNSYGETYEYTYDVEGLRNGKASAEETTRYICESGNVVLETDGIGKVTAKNIWGAKLLERDTNDQTYSYRFNGHGDITALTDEHGYVLEDYEYDPYGNELTETPKFGAGYNWQASQVTYYGNPFRYCGEYYDLETNTYYLRARYYDPTTGRFLSEDTYTGQVTDPLSLNLYTYCGNNPVKYIDPTGHSYDDYWKYRDKKKTSTNSKGTSSNEEGTSSSSLLNKVSDSVKVIGEKLGETGEAIWNNTYASAGVGGGFAGKGVVVGIGVEAGYSGNFAEVRLDNGKFAFGQSQKLAIEVPLLIETFGFGHETKYNGNGGIISDEGYKWVDPSVYPDIPISIASGKLYVMYGGSFDVGIKIVPLSNDLLNIWGKNEGEKNEN
ncbi:MAG: RHS repeat-associated core domain-containing protein [Clostridiaceae bacterium]|nr:RHS repeat-associated core domain-containing protein [Clostridiaceae bacterium]